MKGISPMIAIVILIAFTVAVGGVISFWLTTFAGTQTGAVERGAGGIAECGGVYIKIDLVDPNNMIVVSNPSKNKIYTKAFLDDLGNTYTSGVEQSIASGSIASISVSAFPGSGAEKVTVKGFCETLDGTTNVSIEGVCEKGTPCW
jgi:flagellin-like protein